MPIACAGVPALSLALTQLEAMLANNGGDPHSTKFTTVVNRHLGCKILTLKN
jgi:hypothetical protein